MKEINKSFIFTFLVQFLFCQIVVSFEYDQAYLKSPCADLDSETVNIRVKDETGQLPDIGLGHGLGKLSYYIISAKTTGEVIIECSSRTGIVDWVYNGIGASSGFKVVNTRWSNSDDKRAAHCYSSALVLTNITDQLTGEYICRNVDRTTKESSFRLFVPQALPHYFSEGEEINITVASWKDITLEPITLPCISKDKTDTLTLYKFNETKNEFIKQELGSGLRFDPYVGYQLTPTVEFLTSDDKIGSYECRHEEKDANKTLLKIHLRMQPDEKVVPEKPEVRSTSPYLSWTTLRSHPKLKLDPSTAKHTIYQRYYTKKDYEEDSPNATIFHLGSIHILNETDGATGEVVLYDADQSAENGIIYKWKYFVINETIEHEGGLKYELVDFMHTFTCSSLSNKKPKIELKEITLEGNSIKNDSTSAKVIEKDCGENCVMITTEIPQGIVTCTGDGVDETMRYPPSILASSRPYFVERGRTVHVIAEDVVVTLPCLVNTPAAEVFLFKKNSNSYDKIWSADDEETLVEFYPTWGFHLDTSYATLSDPSGEYICTSSIDLNDRSDLVTVIVRQPPTFRSRVYPSEQNVFGHLNFVLWWESEEELTIKDEEELGNLTFLPALDTAEFIYKGKFEVFPLEENQTKNITLIRSEDSLVIHTWVLHSVNANVEKQSGLTVATIEDENGDHQAVATCRSKSNKKPKISYVHCQNPQTCKLMKNCMDKNCHSDTYMDSVKLNSSGNCSEGCETVIIKSVPTNGLLNISCVGDAVNEFVTISEVFFKEDIHWDSSKDDGYLYLYVNLPPSTDQNPQQEVQNIAPNLHWQLGDAVLFSCAAAPFLFSNGIKWAVEMNDGSFVYQNDSAFDPQFKYSGPTQVLSSMNLLLDTVEIKKVWCFAPVLGSPNEWKNISQPIFITDEVTELCHENEPAIRMINVYPPSSKLNFQFLDPRLDNKEHFILPTDVKQFAVEITAPQPLEWVFSGAGIGPSSTPLVQQDRHISDFFNESTYCYTSRLLLNLRNKNSNDTGRYIVRAKNQFGDIYASFYLFVPNENGTNLIRSGAEINETWTNADESFSRPFLPCVVNDPRKNVLLYKKNDQGEYQEIKIDVPWMYDPKTGFAITNNEYQLKVLGTYKCVVEGNENDTLIVNVIPAGKIKGLKQEQVGEFQVFTCRSDNYTAPQLNFTELTPEGNPVENSEGFILKECPEGCMILMTRAAHGVVNCKGDGVDETVRLSSSNGNARNSDKKTGLWYEKDVGVFKCQANSNTAPKLVAVTCRRPNECEIMQSLLQADGDTSQAVLSSCGDGCTQLALHTRGKSYWPPNWFSTFIRCHSEDGIEIFSQYFFDKGQIIEATLDSVEKFRKIRMDIATIRRQGNSILATFRCFANRYFYSKGFQWGLENNNGTIDIQEAIPREVEVQNFSAIMSEILLDFEETDYKAVWCFAPYLDTPQWTNASISTPIENLIFNL